MSDENKRLYRVEITYIGYVVAESEEAAADFEDHIKTMEDAEVEVNEVSIRHGYYPWTDGALVYGADDDLTIEDAFERHAVRR